MALPVAPTRIGTICFVFVMFSTPTWSAAQEPGSSAKYTRPDVARVENGQFISDYLGIKFSIPSNWTAANVGDGHAEPDLVDGRKVFSLLRLVPSGSPAGGSQIVLRVVDVLHKDIASRDLFTVDAVLSDARPVRHPGIEEIAHVENPFFFCAHYELPRPNPRVYRTKCQLSSWRRFLLVLTVDSAEPVPQRILEEMKDSWQFSLSPSYKEEEEAYVWVQSNFAAVLDQYLPLQTPGEGITHRTTKDLYTNVLEYSFVLRRVYSPPRAYAIVRLADSRSIFDQMFIQRIENPSISLEQVRSRIRVNEWIVGDTECPAAKTSLESFWSAELRRGPEDVIILHPMIYEFHVRNNVIEAKVTVTDNEHPWARWATETRAQLQACVAKSPSSQRGPASKP